MVNDNLANEQPSPAADDVSVVTPYGDVISGQDNAALDAYFGNVPAEDEVSAQASQVPAEAESEEQVEGDEVVEEIDDDSSATEDEVDVKENEDSPLNMDEDSYWEYKNSKGEVEELSEAEVHNRLRRAESASNKSREANTLIEQNEQLKQQLIAEVNAQQASNAQVALHPELQQLGMEAARLKQIADQALAEDSLDFAIHNEKSNRAIAAYHTKEAEIKQLQQVENANKAEATRIKMRQMGLGNVLDDESTRTSFLSYIDTGDADATAAARSNAQIAKWAREAQLYAEMVEKNAAKPAKVKATRKTVGKRAKSAPKKANNNSAYDEGIQSGQNGYLDANDSAILDQYFNR